MIGCVSVTSGSVFVVVADRLKLSSMREFEWILCWDGVRVVVVDDDVIGVVASVTAGW